MLDLAFRTWLDVAYLIAVSVATLFLAYQGWRRVPEARWLALAFGILVVQAAYRLTSPAGPGPQGLPGRGLLVPLVDRTLGAFFLLLLVYALVRPLFPAYRTPLHWLLGSHLAFLVGLSTVVAIDYPQHLAAGMRFADYWGATAYEVYQIPLILAAMGVMVTVRRAGRSPYALLILVALALWLVGHLVHLGGLLVGADTPSSWGVALRVGEIAALLLVSVASVLPDPARRSLATRYLADAQSVVRRLQAEVERLVAAKAALEERERLARELHDSVSQALFSIELNAGAVEALLDRDPGKARERLARLRAAAHEALNDLRALIAELRPPALEGKPLAQALADYARAVEEREGLEINVRTTVEGALDREAEVELFRIGYEALTNIVKHADAGEAWLELDVHPPAFRLRVADDGVGLPAVAGDGEAGRRTFGVSGMQERAALLGARFSIRPRDGGGTEVIVER